MQRLLNADKFFISPDIQYVLLSHDKTDAGAKYEKLKKKKFLYLSENPLIDIMSTKFSRKIIFLFHPWIVQQMHLRCNVFYGHQTMLNQQFHKHWRRDCWVVAGEEIHEFHKQLLLFMKMIYSTSLKFKLTWFVE